MSLISNGPLSGYRFEGAFRSASVTVNRLTLTIRFEFCRYQNIDCRISFHSLSRNAQKKKAGLLSSSKLAYCNREQANTFAASTR